MIGSQDFIAGFKLDLMRYQIDADGCVRHEDQPIHITMQIVRESGAGIIHQPVKAPTHELDRLAFQFALPVLVGFKDGDGGCPERPVIEERHGGIKQELRAKVSHV